MIYDYDRSLYINISPVRSIYQDLCIAALFSWIGFSFTGEISEHMFFLSADLAGWPMRSAAQFCVLCIIFAKRTYLLSPSICRPEVASSLLWHFGSCDLSGQFSTSWLASLIDMCLRVKQFDMVNHIKRLDANVSDTEFLSLQDSLSRGTCAMSWHSYIALNLCPVWEEFVNSAPPNCEAICSETSCQGEKVNLWGLKLYILLSFSYLPVQSGSISYIYAFSRCFYPKWLTEHSGNTFFVSMCVPWELHTAPSMVWTSYCALWKM